MDNFNDKLKQFLHDPIDKCFEIQGHLKRAKEYAEIVGVSGILDVKEPDFIASCMERSFLPSPSKYGFSEYELYQKFNEIRHPFSEGKIEVPSIDKNKVFEKTKNVFENLKLPLDEKLKFLYLWRNLPEETLKAFEGDPVYKYIPILPADTRIPDHSIWEHLKVTAAINAFENIQNNSLFLFSIGPVQSFISQSRKTQDMFMGSFILSYLTFIAIEAVVEECGPTNIIYPDLQGQPLMDWFLKTKGIDVKNSFEKYLNQPTIPNKFVAILPMTDELKIVTFANSLEGIVKDEWNKMANYVLDSFKLDKILEDKGRNANILREKQTSDFPQIFWTAIPLRKGDRDIDLPDLSSFFEKEDISKWDDLKGFIKEKGKYPPNVGFLYGLAYSALEKSLGASKNLRVFKQTEEYGKKCHLCGEREAVINKGMGNLRTGKYISHTEGLCIQCFTKRALDRYLEEKFNLRDFYFPSTAEIASSDFKEESLVESKEAFCSYVDSFNSITKEGFLSVRTPFLKKIAEVNPDVINFDGEWFFEETLTKKKFKDEFNLDIPDSKLNELKEKLRILTKDKKPNSYYAIILLDGDNIGKWLSGEKLPSIENAYNSEIWNKLPDEFKRNLKEKSPNKILTPAIHEAISVALKNYSLEIVRHVVEEEYLGRIVYSGGDDVLALINLRDLPEVLRKLRAGFSGQLKFLNGHTEVAWENRSGFIEKDGKYFLTMGPNASLSAGVLISHYKSPLKVALDRVRGLEIEAKQNKDKDSFSIGLMKRSGGLREIICKFKFESEGKLYDTLQELEAIGNYFEESNKIKISRTFSLKFYEDLKNLTDENGNFLGSSDIFNIELKRLLRRSIDGGKEEKQKAVEELSESFQNLFFNSGIGGNLNNFVNLLEITSFLYGKGA